MPQPLVRNADQPPLATIALVALAAMMVYWVVAGGPAGRMIEIDRAEPLDYEFLVDVNSAAWPELAVLPGIGEVLARRVVVARERRGGFTSAEDLLDVRGIGPRKLARIGPYLLPLPEDRSVVRVSPRLGK